MNMKSIQTHFLILTLVISSLTSFGLFAEETQKIEKKELTLFDLRIPEKDFTSEMQDTRSRKLNGHQHLAALTLGLALASAVTAVIATNKMKDARAARNGRFDSTDADKFNLHAMTAGLTLASYLTTAYYSISAPKSDSMEDTQAVKWHKRIAYIHMPAMIIGPLLGLKAIDDYKKGKNPSGIAKLHKPVMALGIAALAGAAIVVEF